MLFALEGQRALAEAASLWFAIPWLGFAPRGDGQPVLVLPGFTLGDESTFPIRLYLRRLGYSPHRWKLGRNLGFAADPTRVENKLVDRLAEIFERSRRKVSLVGWSLGGIYARELARDRPQMVRQVITLGSPFAGDGRSHVRGLYTVIHGHKTGGVDPASSARLREPPPVPATAVFSRSDGVVDWRACVERPAPHTENIEVRGSHCGLGFNPAVLYAIADRLAEPEGRWRPFRRSGWRRAVYR